MNVVKGNASDLSAVTLNNKFGNLFQSYSSLNDLFLEFGRGSHTVASGTTAARPPVDPAPAPQFIYEVVANTTELVNKISQELGIEAPVPKAPTFDSSVDWIGAFSTSLYTLYTLTETAISQVENTLIPSLVGTISNTSVGIDPINDKDVRYEESSLIGKINIAFNSVDKLANNLMAISQILNSTIK